MKTFWNWFLVQTLGSWLYKLANILKNVELYI